MEESLIAEIYAQYLLSTGVCTDTRKVTKGSLFFALKGGNFDGNQFAHQALKAGAICAVVDDPKVIKSSSYLLVNDVLEALQKVANYHRNKFDIPFIGITGTNGKTTTKELIKTVLSTKYNTYATEGNFNNHIGVPLTLLAMPQDTEIAIIEMGASKVGDIAELCDIAEPNFGLITNIGTAHIQGFGSFEGVLRGKSELYQHLLLNEGTVFINRNEVPLQNMAKRFKSPIFYGGKEDSIYLEFVEATPFVKLKDNEGNSVPTNMVGEYNLSNIASALCIAKYFGIPTAIRNNAIAAYTPTNNRSQIIKKESNTYILDAYNANPSSTSAAISNFSKIKAENKILILGDMLELGEISHSEHQKIITQALSYQFEKVIFCGKEYFQCKKPNHYFFETKEEVDDFLESIKIEDTFLLIKGSRGLKMETLVR